MHKLASLFLTATLIAAPALAKDAKPENPNKKVCRRDMETGSIIPTSVCHTRAEWAAIDQAHSKEAAGFANTAQEHGNRSPLQ